MYGSLTAKDLEKIREGEKNRITISNYMSENFAEDEESKSGQIKKGTFREEGDE